MAASAAGLTLPPGTTETFAEARALTTYRVATGAYDDGVPFEAVDGAFARRILQMTAQDRTPLELLRPLQRQLEAEGYETVFTCATRACGGFDFRFEIDVTPAPDMFVDLADYRYYAARKGPAWITFVVSTSGDVAYIQETRIGPPGDIPPVKSASAPAPQVIVLDGADVVETLVANGRAVLADLTFETGSTALAEGDYPSLRALAAFLRDNPQTTIALVGHTDAEGGAEGNMAISNARANSAKAVLTDAYGIATGRVDTHGVGFFAPVAPNDTEAGRQVNRRVEVVITSTQ